MRFSQVALQNSKDALAALNGLNRKFQSCHGRGPHHAVRRAATCEQHTPHEREFHRFWLTLRAISSKTRKRVLS
jgi:hypothetical protein